MTGIVIREAAMADLEALLELYLDMHGHDAPAKTGAAETAWSALLSHPGAHVLVLEAGGRMASSCILFVHPNLSRGARPFGLVENVVTRVDYRRRGYAGRLLDYALALAWERGCYKVMLLTGRTDPSVHRLYARAGFTAGSKAGYVAYPPSGPP